MNIKRETLKYVIDESIFLSKKVPAEIIEYQGISFKNPTKWVVAFVGSQKGLYNLDGITINPNINLLIVCMMNTEIDEMSVKVVKELVSKTNEGGFMIVRYKQADDVGARDQMEDALDAVRNAIKLYPSKVVPII